MKRAPLFFILILTACAAQPSTPSAALPIVSVYASPATEPWLDDVYACATEVSVVIRLSASQSVADIRLRLGEPPHLTTPAYQIGEEDILVVTHLQNPLRELTADEARQLFAGGEENVEVWVYASGAEIQELFEREVMRGTRIHSSARLALHPQQILDTLNTRSNVVGLLPRRWTNKTIREVFALRNVPVLTITTDEPQSAVKELIACLQK